MTRFYDIDAANATLPDLERILGALASQRADLVRIRDEILARQADGEADPATTGPTETAVVSDDLRFTRLKMQGLVDQMAAGVARIEAMGITLRDIAEGLVDFPALVSGRQVWLCWKRGEPAVEHWHSMESGFSARQPLSELT